MQQCTAKSGSKELCEPMSHVNHIVGGLYLDDVLLIS